MIKKHNILALIPARMGNSRFPGKPMIGNVYDNVKKNQLFSSMFAATCDVQIQNYIKFIGGRVVMILDKYDRASDDCGHSQKKSLYED